MKKTKENPQTDPALERAINAVVLQAKSAGIPSFLFAFRDEKNSTVRFENIRVNDAITLAGLAWVQALQMEIGSHPDYPEGKLKIYKEAIEEFRALVKNTNEKVAKWLKEENGE